MRRLPFRLSLSGLTSTACLAAVVACGGLEDPTKTEGEKIATVTGAITGSQVPAGARVALVWRTSEAGGLAVGAEAPIVGGSFTITLPTPPDAYHLRLTDDPRDGTSGGGTSESPTVPPSQPPADPPVMPEPPKGGAGFQSFGLSTSLEPRDATGQIVDSELKGAIGGFIVYLDKNGNGALDIASDESTPDEILGGRKEIFLIHLQGGGSLEYEELRDDRGVIPSPGFNLVLLPERWVGLNQVELKLDALAVLPGPVCEHVSSQEDRGSDDRPPPPSTPVYPAPDAPGLECGPDGRSFTYTDPAGCTPSIRPKRTLCDDGMWEAEASCGPDAQRESLEDGAEPPTGWPCPIGGT